MLPHHKRYNDDWASPPHSGLKAFVSSGAMPGVPIGSRAIRNTPDSIEHMQGKSTMKRVTHDPQAKSTSRLTISPTHLQL
jgi:hypothetical protein